MFHCTYFSPNTTTTFSKHFTTLLDLLQFEYTVFSDIYI